MEINYTLNRAGKFVVNGVKKVGGWVIKNPDKVEDIVSTAVTIGKAAAGAG